MKHPTLFSFLIFTCFLVGGYTLSSRFYHADNGNTSDRLGMMIASSSNSDIAVNNGQQSILLIGVDYLSTSNHQLTGLWLASYLPSDPTMHLLPVYPSGNDTHSNFEQSLYRSFSLKWKDDSLTLSQDFTKLLVENNYWWSGYFIFDQIALSEIVNFLGEAQSTEELIFTNEQLSDLTIFEGNPQAVFSTQFAVLQMACHNLRKLILYSDWSKVTSLIPNHILTDLDLQQNITEWKILLSDEQNPNCRFPTLEFSGNGN